MAKFLNEYYSVISPTSKTITIERDNGLFDNNNPWTYIEEANRRYKPLKNGEYIIEKGTRYGYEPLIDDSDKDYWTNYINTIERKIKDKPSQNLWQYTFKRMEPIKKEGGTIDKLINKNLKLAGKKVKVVSGGTITLPKNLSEDQAAGRISVYTDKNFDYYLNGDGEVVKQRKVTKNLNGGKINYIDLF